MSTITLIVHRQGVLTIHVIPIRDCLRLLESGLADLPRWIHASKHKRHTDAGYILIDYDEHLLVSSQGGFASSHLDEGARRSLCKRWDLIERY
ncbi:hypothetical protein HY641_01830 [Candidatus Woesearchaeota archaeon]|nr:hypothetical protein [Candidatus Woesearchaeota archaeon]